jgi:subtilisin family serine protease
MSVQIFGGGKSASTAATARAFKYAADNGASVASCSFGFKGGTYTSDNEYLKGNGGSNQMEADAIYYFEASKNNPVLNGGIVIFAAGNDTMDYAEYPGALHDIISVSAFGPDYLPTYYTNYGPGCNIVAPGGEYYHINADDKVTGESEILSTVPSEIYSTDYGYMQGTSMACPHVAGIAALGLSYAKQLGKTFTVDEFKSMLLASANDFDSRLQGTKELAGGTTLQLYKYMKLMGSGSIDTWNFMMKIEGIPSVVVKTGSEQWINVSNWFGTSSVNLTYLGEADGDKVYVDITDTEMAALGLQSKPYMKYGKLFIHPTKAGSCKLTIRAVAGGTIVGGGDNVGGMEVSQTLSVIARDFKSENGGWL